MENKKKYIIAIILFIFLGLMIFTFANTNDDDKKLNGDGNKGNNTEETENNQSTDNNGEETNNTGDDNTETTFNNNQGNNTPVQLTDNSYDLALKAVINAEAKIDDESYNDALNLVNKVTNNKQKDELQKRLDEVKDGIDAKALVAALENKVNTSNNKSDMNNARDFRTDEEIVNKVADLSNATLKQDLQTRLNTLATLLDDTTSPVVNIEDGAFLSSKTEILIEDDNEFVITIKKDGSEDSQEVPNGYEAEEGTYELIVTDEAFNETTVTFTIDLTAPKFNVTSGTHSTSELAISIDDATLDYAEVYNQDTKTKTTEKSNEFTLKDEATYKLTAHDKAGNETVVWVAIDKTNPTITGVENGKSYKDDVTVTIEDKFLTKVLVNDVEQEGIEVTGANNEGKTLVKTFTEEGAYKIVAIDKVGNETTVEFTIDKTPAKRVYSTIRSSSNTKEYKVEKGIDYYISNNSSFVLAISYDEELKANPTAVIGGREIELVLNEKVKANEGKYLYEGKFEIASDESKLQEGLLEITIKNVIDLAGNESKDATAINQTRTSNGRSVIYDRTAPKFNFGNGDIASAFTVKVTDDNFGYMTVINMKTGKKETINTKEYTLPSDNADNLRYDIIAYDKAGNETKRVNIYLDNTKPVFDITGVIANEEAEFVNGGSYQEVTLKVTDGSLKKVENGSTVLAELKNNYNTSKVMSYEKTFDVEGTYTIKATDRNGNTSEVTFTIDKTPAKIKSANILVLGDANEQKVFYAKNGDTIYAYIRADEKLGGNVTFTLNNNGKAYPVDAKDITVSEPNKNGEYTYSIKYLIDESIDMTDGEITITVSGLNDLAGNVTKDVLKPTNGHVVYLDRTLPEVEKVQVFNKNNASSNYVKNGDTVRVQVTFKEELSNVPTLTIGAQSKEFKKISGGNGEVIYSSDIKIAEDEKTLTEGALHFTITGYKDLAENIGNAVDEKSVKSNLTYDRTAPTATVTYDIASLTNHDVTATLTASEEVEILKDETWNPKEGFATVFKKSYPVNTTQTVTLKDKAGNTSTIDVVINNIDKKAPKVTLYADNGKVVKNGTVQNKNIKAVIEEENGYTTILKNQNGKEIAFENDKFITERGNFTLTVTDKAGNVTEVTFGIDKDYPLVYLNNVKYEKVIKDTKYYNKSVNGVTIKVTDLNLDSIELTKDGKKVDFENGNTITEEGNYVITAIDKAGIKTQVPFMIDKTNPKFKPEKWNYTLEVDKNAKFTCPDMTSYVTDNLSGVKSVVLDNWYATHTSIPDQTKLGNFVCRYFSTDKAGNKVSNDIFYKVVDTTKPKVNVVSSNKYKLEAGSTYVDKGYSAIDNYDGDITDKVVITYQFQAKGTSTWPFVDELDTNKLGTYKIIYTVTDSSGNTNKGSRVVEVVDTTAPTIVLPEGVVGLNKNEMHIEAGEVVKLEGLVSATDTIDPNPVVTLKYVTFFAPSGLKEDNIYNYDFSKGIDTTKVGRYNLDYEAKDASGNVSKRTLMIIIKDTTAPTIELPEGVVGLNKNEMHIEAGDAVELEGLVTAKDVADNNPIVTLKDVTFFAPSGLKEDNIYHYDFSKGIDTTKVGRYNLDYEAKDASGNVSKRTLMIMIKDTTAPTIKLNGDEEITVEGGEEYEDLGVKITDNTKENIEAVIKVYYSNDGTDDSWVENGNEVNTKKVGYYRVVYTATDASGNTSSVKRTVKVVDTTPAELTLNREDGYTVEAGSEYVELGATVTDNVDPETVIYPETYVMYDLAMKPLGKTTDKIDTRVVGRYLAIYNHKDSSGNASATFKRWVVVQDTTAPTVTLNGDATMNLVGGVDTYTELNATVVDNADDTINNLAPAYINYYTLDGTFLGRVDNVNTNAEGRYNLVYFTKDSHENESTKITRTVYVRFQQPTNKVFVQTVDDLMDLSANPSAYKGKEIYITNDIDLKGKTWTPINAWAGALNDTVIDGMGHSIKNMTVTGDDVRNGGFIGLNASKVTIKNLVFNNANVKTVNASQTYAGVVIGKDYSNSTLENITVKNSRVENNWQSGGLVGFAEGTSLTFKNCHVANTFVGGENATSGTLFGLGIVSINVENCTAKDVSLYTDGLTWDSTQKAKGNFWVGHLYGKTLTVTNSTEENVNVVTE